MLFILAMVATVAAVEINVSVDDPCRVRVSYLQYANSDDYIGTPVTVELQAGENAVEIAQDYTILTVEATECNLLTSVLWKGNAVNMLGGGVSAQVYLYGGNDAGAVLEIATATEADVRTAHLTVAADDPEAVHFMFTGSYRTVELQEGDNSVAFAPTAEGMVRVHHTTAGRVLYRVLRNGDAVAANNSQAYEFAVADGDRIDIASAFPDESFPLTINIPEEVRDAVTEVRIDGKKSTMQPRSVPAGSKVEVSLDTENYRINSVQLNGEDLTVSYYIAFVMTGEMTLDIEAEAYAMLSVGLDVTDPSQVHVYHGAYVVGGDNEEYQLTAGLNEVQVSERLGYITVMIEEGCYFTDFSCGGVQYSGNSDYGYGIRVENLCDGDVVTLHTAAIVRDKQFVLYIDNKEAAEYQFFCSRSDHSEAEVATGYNYVSFFEGDNPVEIGWAGENIQFHLYRNGEEVLPIYENTTYAALNVAEGDVVKAFTTELPPCYTATISVRGGNADDVTVVKDLVTNVPREEWQSGVTDFAGTQIELRGVTGVKVDGEYATVLGDKCTLTLTADCAVAILGTTDAELVPADAGPVSVYDAQGVLIMRNATQADVERLPHGFYIVGGQKVVR
ncbi:MAG: hypothetical protein ACI4UN_03420 [Muribaculaceae bacterium]